MTKNFNIPKCHRFQDITGKRIGELTVTRYSHKNKKSITFWECKCSCGKTVVKSRKRLMKSKDCGCFRKLTHGDSKKGKVAAEYHSWRAMIGRCTNPNATGYDIYGGRGIKVCDKWLSSYEAFLSDMGRKGSNRDSIDRIDVDGDYTPENCRWATPREQGRNKRGTNLYEWKGEFLTIPEIAEKEGVSKNTIRGRMYKGLTIHLAVTLPSYQGICAAKMLDQHC